MAVLAARPAVLQIVVVAMPDTLVEDTLSFCYPALGGTLVGPLVGLLQFVPWLAAPSLFLDASHGGSGEVVYRLWLLFLKLFALLGTGLQLALARPVPNAACTDPFGSPFGMPSLGAGVLAAYAALDVGLRLCAPSPPSWRTLSVLAFALVIVPAALVADGLHTGAQVVAGLALGGAFGALASLLTHTLLVPHVLPAVLADPDGVGWILGTRDTYLVPHTLARTQLP